MMTDEQYIDALFAKEPCGYQDTPGFRDFLLELMATIGERPRAGDVAQIHLAYCWVSIEPSRRVGVLPKISRIELLAKQLPLLCLAVLCLSGCLTAAKIGEWHRAVYGWGMDPGASKPCQVASAEASAYLANANQRLAEAGKVTDLASDSRARELLNSAAQACGKVAP